MAGMHPEQLHVQYLGTTKYTISFQLEEIASAVNTAEADYNKFKIEKDEIGRRRQWISATRTAVQGMRAPAVRAREEEEQKKKARSKPQAKSAAEVAAEQMENNAYHKENNNFIGSEHDRQKMMLKSQDDDLDDLAQSVKRIGEIGITIGNELTEQGQMLQEMDEQVDGVTSRLGAAQRKMKLVIEKAGICGQMGIILALVGVIIILIYFAFM